MPQVLSTTPTFNPYSLDEILKVPLMIKAEQDKITEDYNKEADKIQQIRNIAMLHPEVQPLIDAYDKSFNELTESLNPNSIADMRDALRRTRQGYRDLSQIQSAYDIYNERMKPLLAEQAKKPGRFFVDKGYNLQSIMNNPNAIPNTFDMDILEKDAMTYGSGYANDLGGRYVKGGFDVTYSGMNPNDQDVFRLAMSADNDDDFNNIISAASTRQSRDIMKAMRNRLNDMATNYGYDEWSDQLPMLKNRSMEAMLAAMPYKESYSRIPVSNSSGERVGNWHTMTGKDGKIYHWRELGTTGTLEIRTDKDGKPGDLATVDGAKNLGPGFTFSGRAGIYNEKASSGKGGSANSNKDVDGFVLQASRVDDSFDVETSAKPAHVSFEDLDDENEYTIMAGPRVNIIKNNIANKYPDITQDDIDVYIMKKDHKKRKGEYLNSAKDDATFFIKFKKVPAAHLKGYSTQGELNVSQNGDMDIAPI